jgi:hypothetical protein
MSAVDPPASLTDAGAFAATTRPYAPPIEEQSESVAHPIFRARHAIVAALTALFVVVGFGVFVFPLLNKKHEPIASPPAVEHVPTAQPEPVNAALSQRVEQPPAEPAPPIDTAPTAPTATAVTSATVTKPPIETKPGTNKPAPAEVTKPATAPIQKPAETKPANKPVAVTKPATTKPQVKKQQQIVKKPPPPPPPKKPATTTTTTTTKAPSKPAVDCSTPFYYEGTKKIFKAGCL